jgi:hypothetical protein
MKKLLNSFLLLSAIASICSCVTPMPISSSNPQNNKTYEVEYLFEHEGCKVYRFMDNGHYVYFTNSNNTVSSIENDSIQIKVVNKIIK